MAEISFNFLNYGFRTQSLKVYPFWTNQRRTFVNEAWWGWQTAKDPLGLNNRLNTNPWGETRLENPSRTRLLDLYVGLFVICRARRYIVLLSLKLVVRRDRYALVPTQQIVKINLCMPHI